MKTRLTLLVLLGAMAVVCALAQSANAASGGLLSAVLSLSAGADAVAIGPVGRLSALALSLSTCIDLSLESGLSSNFMGAVPVAREVALSLTEGPRRRGAVRRLAKYLPNDFAHDIARIEGSGSGRAALAWGSAIKLEVGEDMVAEGVASGDTVRWLAGLRQRAGERHGDDEYEIGVRAHLSTVQRGTISVSAPIAVRSGAGRAAVGFSLSALSGKSLYDASFAGIAQKMPDGKGKLVGSLDKMEWDESRGWALGYAVDVAGAVALSERVSLGACLRNAIGAITWEDTLFVEGIVNTDTVTVDENGYLVYAPTMIGVQRTECWRQALPRALEAGLDADLYSTRVNARLFYDGQRLLPSAGVAFDLNGLPAAAGAAGPGWNGRLPRLELGWRMTPALRSVWRICLDDQGGRWSVLLEADRLNPEAAKALAANVRVGFDF